MHQNGFSRHGYLILTDASSISFINLYITLFLTLTYTATLFFFPEYLGGATIFASVIGIFISSSLTAFVVSLLNFSLGVAFDYFLRVFPYFHFYDEKGMYPETLCYISGLVYCSVLFLDSINHGGAGLKINILLPNISKKMFYPLILIVLYAIAFLMTNENTILEGSFSMSELQKYPLLEYVSLVIYFLVAAAKHQSAKKMKVAVFLSIAYIVVCLATSYRMVAIISSLALWVAIIGSTNVKRWPFVFVWLISYVFLTAISYYRLGVYEIDLEMILGYQNGRLDNTFTGVIETGLVYTSIAKSIDFYEILRHLIGVIAPWPNTFIPDDYIYSVSALRDNIVPGGGLLAAFIVYFWYLLLLPYTYVFYNAFSKSGTSYMWSGVYLIILITSVRWWLYGPNVIFKYIGVYVLLLLTSKVVDFMLQKYYDAPASVR